MDVAFAPVILLVIEPVETVILLLDAELPPVILPILILEVVSTP